VYSNAAPSGIVLAPVTPPQLGVSAILPLPAQASHFTG
jgi:hypothetical protein